MIFYKNVLEKLNEAGYSTYRIRKEKLIPESTMQKLRTNGTITTETVNTICRLLHCQPNDVMEYQENTGEDL